MNKEEIVKAICSVVTDGINNFEKQYKSQLKEKIENLTKDELGYLRRMAHLGDWKGFKQSLIEKLELNK